MQSNSNNNNGGAGGGSVSPRGVSSGMNTSFQKKKQSSQKTLATVEKARLPSVNKDLNGAAAARSTTKSY